MAVSILPIIVAVVVIGGGLIYLLSRSMGGNEDKE